MSNCTVDFRNLSFLFYIFLAMSMVSVAMCVTAIAILIHFKFYRSFNYRLILYQLISFLLFVIGLSSVILLSPLDFSICPEISEVEVSYGSFMFAYLLWNILMCIAFMTAEIFSMVIFFVELRRAEIPTTIACFLLPLIPALVSSIQTELDTYLQVTYGLGMVVAGVCIVPVVVALTVLACRSHRGCSNDDNEEQHLLHQQPRQDYRTALKEILPFIAYPITILLWLLINFIEPFIGWTSPVFSSCIIIINGNMGTISAIVFFVHIRILGWRRRNAFRRHAYIIPPINTTSEICEDQKFTVAGSITATHVSHFDPLGEDDIEA